MKTPDDLGRWKRLFRLDSTAAPESSPLFEGSGFLEGFEIGYRFLIASVRTKENYYALMMPEADFAEIAVSFDELKALGYEEPRFYPTEDDNHVLLTRIAKNGRELSRDRARDRWELFDDVLALKQAEQDAYVKSRQYDPKSLQFWQSEIDRARAFRQAVEIAERKEREFRLQDRASRTGAALAQ